MAESSINLDSDKQVELDWPNLKGYRDPAWLS